jgi:guanylate kinase
MSATKFLLLLGPSGTGKSCLMWALQRIDSRYVYISPCTNRSLREGEVDKVSISDATMDRMAAASEFLVINEKFGWRYATPRGSILDAFEAQQFPLLDWPVDRLDVMKEAFGNKLFTVYVAPPSIEVLESRLMADGRDSNGSRLQAAIAELESHQRGEFDSSCDLTVVSHEGQTEELARHIHAAYLQSIG